MTPDRVGICLERAALAAMILWTIPLLALALIALTASPPPTPPTHYLTPPVRQIEDD